MIIKTCDCGSNNIGVFSCEEIENKIVEIIHICNDCCNMYSEKHYLYKNK